MWLEFGCVDWVSCVHETSQVHQLCGYLSSLRFNLKIFQGSDILFSTVLDLDWG